MRRKSRRKYHKLYKRKWRERNRAKNNAHQRKWWAQVDDKKERAFIYRLKTRYGITIEQYQTLLQGQGGACAVCKRPAAQFPRRLAVDHNHKTLEIRGLLCTHCNRTVVGRHTEGALLRAAADYLDRSHTTWLVPTKTRKRKRRGRKNSVA